MLERLNKTRNSRRRDVSALTLGFIAILVGLCGLGFLGWRAGIGAGLLGAAIAFAYARTTGPAPEIDRIPLPEESDKNSVQDAQSAVVEALGQPALIVKNSQLAAFNTAAARLFSLVEGARPPVASLRHPLLLAGIEDVRSGGERYECEIVPARHPEQSWLAHMTALAGEQELPDILIVLTDLAPVRQAERARADFLANASHELRTPLTSISGFVETMQGVAKDDQESWPRFVDIIAEQARHMKGLISDLLSLSRIELGAHEAPDTIIDLGQVLSESVEAMGHTMIGRDAQLKLDLPIERDGSLTDLSVIGSESEVKQVIQNLIGNAVKYSPENGEIEVCAGLLMEGEVKSLARSWVGASRVTLFSSAAGAGNDGVVWFSVRDQGGGIAPQFLPRLGERFFRVDDSRGGPVEGTGLGLAIVKHIMAHHQGGMAVESVVGQGALFTVWFKAAPTAAGD